MTTAEPCCCEHARHFPLAETFGRWPEIPRTGHGYLAVPSTTDASIVGRVCDECAIGCIPNLVHH